MKLVRLVWLLVVVGALSAAALAQGSAKVVKVTPGESVYKVKRGGSVQVAVVLDVDEDPVVIHAMALRPKWYRHLSGRGGR